MAQVSQVTRRRQRRRRVALLVLLVVVLGGLVWLVAGPGEPEGPPRIERKPGWVEIPVAAVEIPVGRSVQRNTLRSHYLPPSRVPPGALLQQAQILGRVALRNVPPGAYLQEDDLGPLGAPAGLSGLARPGKRILVVEMTRILGAAGFLSSGDRVDVLGVTWPSVIGPAGRQSQLEASANTVQGGGVQPGDPNAPARRGRMAGRSELDAVATLLAEDVEIVRPPPGNLPVSRQYVILQMAPQDAHVLSLALAANQTLRLVHRPFSDRVRVAEPQPPEEFTRVPTDVRRVEVFNGTRRSLERTTLD